MSALPSYGMSRTICLTSPRSYDGPSPSPPPLVPISYFFLGTHPSALARGGGTNGQTLPPSPSLLLLLLLFGQRYFLPLPLPLSVYSVEITNFCLRKQIQFLVSLQMIYASACSEKPLDFLFPSVYLMANLFPKKTSPPIHFPLPSPNSRHTRQLGRIIVPTTHRGDPQPRTEYTLTSLRQTATQVIKKEDGNWGEGSLLKKSHFSQFFLSSFFLGGGEFAASLFGPKHLLKKQINLFF